jgi:hypothetical protein
MPSTPFQVVRNSNLFDVKTVELKIGWDKSYGDVMTLTTLNYKGNI